MVEADGIKEAGDDNRQGTAAHPVAAVQIAADQTQMALDVPDGLAAAAPVAKDGQIIAVAERMVTGDELHQGGFAAAIRPGDKGMVAGADSEIKPLEDLHFTVAGKAIAQHHQRLVIVSHWVAGSLPAHILHFYLKERLAAAGSRYQRCKHRLDARGRAGVAQFPILYQGKMAAPLRQICRVAA